jgi:TonB family protein
MRHRWIVPLTLMGLCLGATAATSQQPLMTEITVLSGHPGPEEPGTTGVLLVPGTVIPLGAGREPTHAELRRIVRTSEVLADISGKLERTLRLASVEVLFHRSMPLELERPADFSRELNQPPVGLRVTLLGYSGELATYRVELHDEERLLADSTVSIVAGRRAVIGAPDGTQAPYLFVVLEPSHRSGVAVLSPQAGITPPRRLHAVQPEYPQDAREARVVGVVIVQAVIDKEGRIEELRALKGLPMGLTEAALEAVGQWRFEPALDADGNPVAVYYNLVINFQLDPEAS